MKHVIPLFFLFSISYFGVCQKMEVAIPLGHTKGIKSTAFSNNDRLLATSSEDNTIVLWDLATGVPFKKWYAGKDVVQLYFFNDSTLFYEREYAEIGFWNIKNQKKTHLDSISVNQHVIYNDSLKQIAVIYQTTYKGDFGFAAGLRIVCFWPLTNRNFQFDIPYTSNLDLRWGSLRFSTISKDGRYLAVGSSQGFIKVWDLESESVVFEDRLQIGDLDNVWGVISDNSHFLAISTEVRGNNKKGQVCILDLKKKQLIINKKIENGFVDKLVFASNDSLLIGYNSYPRKYPFVDIIDTQDGGLHHHLSAHNVDVEVFPGTALIAGIYDREDREPGKELRLYNAKTGSVLKKTIIREGRKILTSNNGRFFLLTTPFSGSQMDLYDIKQLYAIRELKGYVSMPNDAYFIKGHLITMMINAGQFFEWPLGNSNSPFPKFNAVISQKSVYNAQNNTMIDFERNLDNLNLDDPLDLTTYHLGSRQKTRQKTDIKPTLYFYPFISPSGNRLGVQFKDQSQGVLHKIWFLDSANKRILPKTYILNDYNINVPILSLKGKYLFYNSFSNGSNGIEVTDLTTNRKIDLAPPNPNENTLLVAFAFSHDEKRCVVGYQTYSKNGAGGILDNIGYWSLGTGRFVQKIAPLPFSPERMSISKDEGRIAVSNDLGDILILDQAGKTLNNLKGHTATINSIDFSYDNKYLLSTSADGTTKFWSLAKNKLLVSLITFLSGDWMLITPEGYYYGTPGAASMLYFNHDLKLYSFEDFDLQYNRPDKVLEKIGIYPEASIQLYRRAFKKREERYSQINIQSTDALPTVKFANRDSIPLDTKLESIKIGIIAESDNTTIESLLIWVNGVPILGSKGLSVQGINQQVINKEISIALTEGNNVIQIGCRDAIGKYALRQTTNVYCRKPSVLPSIYFVGVGISRYQDSTSNLQYASKDINDLKGMLDEIMTYRKGYQDLKWIVLQDEMATKEKILKSKELLQQSKPEDIILLSFNGHGLLSKNLDFHFATYDTDFNAPEQRAIKYEEIEELLDSIPARNRLILLDACHSGDVEKNGLTNLLPKDSNKLPALGQRGIELEKMEIESSFELMLSLFTNLNISSGNTVFAASGGQEVALEGGSINNGVFTHSLLEVLKSLWGPTDINQLKNLVEAKVKEITDGKQQPNFRRVNYKNNFLVPRP